MSLITESVATVIEGQSVLLNNANFETLTTLPEFYKVFVGYASPREIGYYLLKDSEGNYLQLPPNSVALYSFFVPFLPLESGDNSMTTVDTFFADNPQLTSKTNRGFSFTLDQITLRCMNQVTYTSESAEFYNNNPYIGINTSVNPITNGTLQVYIYYTMFPVV